MLLFGALTLVGAPCGDGDSPTSADISVTPTPPVVMVFVVGGSIELALAGRFACPRHLGASPR